MKKRVVSLLLAAVCVLALAACGKDDAEKKDVLVMATNAEFPPYESKDSSGEIVGIDVDMMKAVCDKLDRKLKITNTAFDSIVVNVERKMADAGVAAMTITEERKKYVDFSDSYMTATQVVIVRK